ncbi:zinc-binding dehydrogenase [Nitriliruptoraceae bacterium ZYF776]|nr:zinc-binding dehydrogenase [Profundirhabdus halotolerans]
MSSVVTSHLRPRRLPTVVPAAEGAPVSSARALVCDRLGDGRDVGDLRVAELLLAAPVPGEVVVRVAAANVAFVDRLLLAGAYQVKPATPYVAGTSFVGEVVATADGAGPGVGTVVAGLRVDGGAFASHVVVAADALVALGVAPASPDTTTLAGALEAYVTAHLALERRVEVTAGERVVVLGAGGAVGHACVDLAHRAGATVAGVTSRPAALTAAFGADVAAIDVAQPLRDALRAWAPDGVDVVVDPVGGAVTEQALRRLTAGGRLLVVGFASGEVPRLPANHVLLRNRAAVGVDLGALLREGGATAGELLAAVVPRLVDGPLRPRPVRSVALAELPDRLRGDASLSDLVVVPDVDPAR